MINARDEDRRQIRRMRLASVLEATTLAVLVFIAVPLKHAFGMPQLVSAMGPIHGLAFLFYLWMLIQSHFQLRWSGAEWARMVAFAFIPLAGFVNDRLLKRREDNLAHA
jgi:integral membrane protein